MDRRKVLKRALILAVPIMIQNGITNAVGLVDHIMVGSLGTEAMTAVSIVGQLLFVFALALFGGAFELKMQALALLALPLIWLYKGEKGKDLIIAGRKINIGYWFYPLHLAILCLLRQIRWML